MIKVIPFAVAVTATVVVGLLTRSISAAVASGAVFLTFATVVALSLSRR